MYVCICKNVTDHEICDAIDQGFTDLDSLKKELGVCTECGSCYATIIEILESKVNGTIEH